MMAALIYDIISLQGTGLHIKTNLNYSKLDVIAVLSIDQLFDENLVTNGPEEQELPSSLSENESSSNNSNWLIAFYW